MCFHVDDGLATSTDLSDLKLLEEQFRSEYGEELKITYGKSHEYLGLALDIDNCDLTLLDMSTYYGFENCHWV